MVSEKLKHKLLKEQARIILRLKGFKLSQIKEEYRWERYVIDIAGIKKDKIIFIECGIISQDKFNYLTDKKTIELIHLPYLNCGNSIIGGSKFRVTVTIDANTLKGCDKLIKQKKFRSRSHAIEYYIEQGLLRGI